jgi:putative endonuclease
MASEARSIRPPASRTCDDARVPATWFVYILECADASLYTGIATDVPRRIAEHEAGKGARYTRGRGPLRLIYSELCEDRSSALKREAAIKKLPARRKRALYSSRSR